MASHWFAVDEMAHCDNRNCKWTGRAVDAVELRENIVCPVCGSTAYVGSRDETIESHKAQGRTRTKKGQS